MLGDKIKEILDWWYRRDTTYGQKEAIEELDKLIGFKNGYEQLQESFDKLFKYNEELLEKCEAYEKSLEYGASVSIGSLEGKLLDSDKRCKELEKEKASSKEVIEELTLLHAEVCEDIENHVILLETLTEENQQIKKDILLDDALKWAVEKRDASINMHNGITQAFGIKCLPSYRKVNVEFLLKEHKQQLKKEDVPSMTGEEC